ncbi:iron ABC transporter permease [Tessaracoccus sp. ZS01]|uniref:iron ABC transporter permease n=1 Tax=Tessaracoccus sp. ZS01 TaxID=1906324 RepID=UPI0013018B31|nr:iron ABC transporter permease [Tessaracoccus sp. ZS01]
MTSTPGLPSAPTRAGIAALGSLGIGVVLLALVHLGQGTSNLPLSSVWAWLTGSADPATSAIIHGARLPRLVGGLVIGALLGAAGTLMQAVARNPLASPDTLAVSSGAQLAVTVVAALGINLAVPVTGAVALAGAALAALVVVTIAGTREILRVVLVGSALAMGMSSFATFLLLVRQQETMGLYAWGSGSLVLSDVDSVRQLAPAIVVAVLAAFVLAGRLRILTLQDDQAQALGANLPRERLIQLTLAVTMCAVTVTIAGPIGFVGLVAPVGVSLASRGLPVLRQPRFSLAASMLLGAALVIGADVALRALGGAAETVKVPTGVVTSIVGGLLLVLLGRRAVGMAGELESGRPRSGRWAGWVTAAAVGAVFGTAAVGLLFGDLSLLLGDLGYWLQGQAQPTIAAAFESRSVRVAAALLAGAALGLAGTCVQVVTRNGLADPGLLGVTAGGGLAAVLMLWLAPDAGPVAVQLTASLGALLTFVVVVALAGGASPVRVVLVGIGAAAALQAVTTVVVLSLDPWDTAAAQTWLAGSTYGRAAQDLAPVAVTLLITVAMLWLNHRTLDLLALGEDQPTVLGVRTGQARWLVLAAAALLAAAAITAAGTVGFVGLVAPHVARRLVGAAHKWVIPASILLGAVLLGLADTIGRSLIAPAQIPAGLVVALVGTPVFALLIAHRRRHV